MNIEAQFSLIDHINPSCGYSLRITNAENGDAILFTGVNPMTGEDLLTAKDCIEVIGYYTINKVLDSIEPGDSIHHW